MLRSKLNRSAAFVLALSASSFLIACDAVRSILDDDTSSSEKDDESEEKEDSKDDDDDDDDDDEPGLSYTAKLNGKKKEFGGAFAYSDGDDVLHIVLADNVKSCSSLERQLDIGFVSMKGQRLLHFEIVDGSLRDPWLDGNPGTMLPIPVKLKKKDASEVVVFEVTKPLIFEAGMFREEAEEFAFPEEVRATGCGQIDV